VGATGHYQPITTDAVPPARIGIDVSVLLLSASRAAILVELLLLMRGHGFPSKISPSGHRLLLFSVPS
jgi:hypothetical protein